MKCPDCTYCEVVVKEGDPYTYINAYGDELHRVHDSTLYICRSNPPITGRWPEVLEDDWCGEFTKNE